MPAPFSFDPFLDTDGDPYGDPHDVIGEEAPAEQLEPDQLEPDDESPA